KSLAHVVANARSAQNRPGEKVVGRRLLRDDSTIRETIEKNTLPRQKTIAIVEQLAYCLERPDDVFGKAVRQIVLDPANAYVRDCEPCAGQLLDDSRDQLAPLDHIKTWGNRAKLGGRHAATGEVIVDSRQLA